MNKIFQRMTPHAAGQRWRGLHITPHKNNEQLIPVAAWVSGCPLAGIAGSNSAGALLSVFCACCVLPGRAVCEGPIPRPEESYSVCVCLCVCLCV